MLLRRLRRLTNIKPTLNQRLMLTDKYLAYTISHEMGDLINYWIITLVFNKYYIYFIYYI